MTTANLTVIGNVLFKRGNSTVASAYTGVAGEIIIDTTLQTIRVQDGVTSGGHVLASAQDAANIVGFSSNIDTLLSNAAAQATQILALQSNAALQASLIDSLTGNAATQGGALNDLVANAATQAQSLTTLTANAATQANSLTDLIANAATQAQQIANVSGTYGNANVKSYLVAFDGNIVPDGDNTRDLGSPTNQWRHVYTGGGSIYLDNIKLTNNAGKLEVTKVINPGEDNEEPDPEDSNAGDSVTSKLTNGEHEFVLTEQGTLELDGTPFTGGGPGLGDFTIDGDILEADQMTIRTNDGDLVVQSDSDVIIRASGTDKQWQFNTSGNLELPEGGDIVDHMGVSVLGGGGGGGGISIVRANVAPVDTTALWYDTNSGRLYVYYDSFWVDTSAGSGGGGNPFDQELDSNSAVSFASVGAAAINVSQINGTNPGQELVIQAGGLHNFSFQANARLGLPYGSYLRSFESASVELTAGGSDPASYASLASFNSNNYIWVDNAAAYIGTNWQAGPKTWTFGTDGNLTIPGNIVYANGASILSDYATISSTLNTSTTSQSTNDFVSGNYYNADTLSVEYTAYTGASTLNFSIGAQKPLDGNIGINVAAISTPLIQSLDGTLTMPVNITGANVISASTFVSNSYNVVTAGNLSITSQYGLGTTGTILEDNGTLELIAKGGGSVVVGWDSTYGNGLGNLAVIGMNALGSGGVGITTGNQNTTIYNWVFNQLGQMNFPGGGSLNVKSPAPTHSYGVAGDQAGMIAFDNDYFYYCKTDYVNNSTDIWVRVVWTSSSW